MTCSLTNDETVNLCTFKYLAIALYEIPASNISFICFSFPVSFFFEDFRPLGSPKTKLLAFLCDGFTFLNFISNSS